MNSPTYPSSAGDCAIVINKFLTRDLAVPDNFYRALLGRARDRIQYLNYEEIYKAQDVFGWDYWNTLDRRDRSLAGRVLAHLVASEELPLKFASCRLCTIKHYERLG